MRFVLIGMATMAVSVVASPSDAAITYSPTELGCFSGARCLPQAISPAGQFVAGRYSGPDFAAGLFRYSPQDGIEEIQLSGDPDDFSIRDITSSGTVLLTFIGEPDRSYVWEPGKLRQIEGPPGAGVWTNSLSDTGLAVGGITFTEQYQVTGYSFVYNQAQESLEGFSIPDSPLSSASEVNPEGTLLVGNVYVQGLPLPKLYTHDLTQQMSMVLPRPEDALALSQAQYATAVAINAAGQVAIHAVAQQGGVERALVWDGDSYVAIGSLGRKTVRPQDMNNAGTIVGYSYASGAGEPLDQRAFIWQNGQDIVDLTTLLESPLGWNLLDATGIDRFGTIVGYGLFQGEARAFFLTPIPEPASVALWLLSLPVLLGIRRRSFI